MPRLIDADGYKRVLEGWLADMQSTEEHAEREAILSCICQLDAMQTADAAPVVHGRWELLRKGDWNSVFVCSVCGRRETIAESESYNSQLKMPKKYPYCHCGAKMDGEDGDGNDEAIL